MIQDRVEDWTETSTEPTSTDPPELPSESKIPDESDLGISANVPENRTSLPSPLGLKQEVSVKTELISASVSMKEEARVSDNSRDVRSGPPKRKAEPEKRKSPSDNPKSSVLTRASVPVALPKRPIAPPKRQIAVPNGPVVQQPLNVSESIRKMNPETRLKF